ncbi:hypothetical protein D3C71_1347370 [compost metagenome]
MLVPVGAHLRGDAGAAAFLVQVQQHAAAQFLELAQAAPQLVAAVALERTEQIAGQARGMHANRHHGGQIRGAHDDRDLVTLGHPAAEHREFGHADLAQRHRRAGHQFIRVRGLLGALAEIAQRDLRAVVEAAVIGGQQHADHRRQQQAEAGDFHRAVVQRFATGPARRHRPRVAQVAQ